MSEEEKEERGFKITDRRLKVDEETPEEEPIKEASEEDKTAPARPAGEPKKPKETASSGPSVLGADGEPVDSGEVPEREPPPMNFPNFIISLASSALIQLGMTPHPEDGKTHTDLEGARQTIDIITMLEEKTRGNLTREEESLLKSVLTDLRIRFVDKKSGR